MLVAIMVEIAAKTAIPKENLAKIVAPCAVKTAAAERKITPITHGNFTICFNWYVVFILMPQKGLQDGLSYPQRRSFELSSSVKHPCEKSDRESDKT